MQPNVSKTTQVLSFSIDNYTAVLFNNIESSSVIQYHYILAIYSPDSKNPLIFICSEWSSWNPNDKNKPCIGIFVDGKHSNDGFDERWYDQNLFLLRAIEIFKEKFNVDLETLTEGEASALSKIMSEINLNSNGQLNLSEERQKLLWNTISYYDQPLAKYLKSYKQKDGYKFGETDDPE